MEWLHRTSAWALVALIALHLAGVAFTSWRDTGKKPGRASCSAGASVPESRATSPDGDASYIGGAERAPVWNSADLAHLRLQIVLQPDLVDQVDLGFEEVDVLFRVVQNFLQQVA